MAIKRNSGQTNANRTFAAAETVTANVLTSVGVGGGTVISSITVTNSSYVPQSPATSYISTSGGYITISGTGFTSASQLYIQGNLVTSTTYVSSTQINAQIPAYNTSSVTVQQIYVVNTSTNAAGILITGFGYGVVPYWTTNGSFTGSTPSISTNLSALSDSTMTYAVLSGTVPNGLSLNTTTGVLSGTISTGTSTTFVVQAVNVQNQSNTQTFTITILSTDSYFYETTLLLNGETSTSTYIADASTSSLALTVNGTVTPNRFSPLWGSGYYGVSFDGSSGYLNLSSTFTQLGSSNWTCEAWIYPTAFSSIYSGHIFWLNGDSTSYAAVRVQIGTSGAVSILGSSTGGSWIVSATSSNTLTLNSWYHIAYVRNGTSFTLYVNGVNWVSATASGALYGATNNLIGNMFYSGGGTWLYQGYMSNARIVVGTAVYTSNFTPSTSPLTAITGTSLLTCQSPNFTDSSTNNFTITPSGTVKVVPNQPFGTLPSSITVNTGYSTYFNGSTDYLTAPASGNFAQGVFFALGATFTVEAWLWQNSYVSASGYYNIVLGDASPTGTAMCWSVGTDNSNKPSIQWYDGNSRFVTGTVALSLNTWNHVAWVVSAGVISIYVNGVAQTKSIGDTLTTPTQTTGMVIGADRSRYYNGYISNLRAVKGVAVYTGSFTPPTSPLPITQSSGTNITAITGTSTTLLTCQGSQITDVSNTYSLTPNGSVKVLNNNYPFTQTTATVSSVSNFGGGYFDGSTGYLTAPNTNNLTFGTGDFSIEFWVYHTSIPTSFTYVDTRPSGSNGNYLTFAYNNTPNGLFLYAQSTMLISTGITPTANIWNHLVLNRISGTSKIYLNGVQIGSASDGTNYGIGAVGFVIAGNSGVGNYMPGYISNFRVIKGSSIYTSNFAPPTSPLTAITNTQLLTLQNKQGANNNTFYDDSTNNFALTRSGTTTQGTFTPFSPTGWSNYFNGSTDYLTVPNNAAFNLTGSFTVETWVYLSANPNVNSDGARTGTVCAYGVASSTNTGYEFDVTTGASGQILFNKLGTGTGIQCNYIFSLNTWYHIAITYNGSTGAIYVNGVSQTLTGNTWGWSAPPTPGFFIARGVGYSGYLDYFPGYISNFRIVNGSVVYTSNFTPPISPLTAITNTALLTCQSNRFIDNSSNAFALTISGSPSVQAFSPFAPGVTYSPTTHGGSMYFDGSSSYLQMAQSAGSIGTSQFTIECWLYPTTWGDSIFIEDAYWYSGNNGGWYLSLASSTGYVSLSGSSGAYNNTSNFLTSTSSVPLNQWSHFACTRDGSNVIRMFINGVAAGSVTYATSLGLSYGSAGSPWATRIGAHIADNALYNKYTGYISNVRIVVGTALYTSNFTSPTAPPTPTANTSLLLLGTNGGVIDQSSRNDLITVGSATVRNSTFKYGSGSISFNGSSDYLKSPQSLLHDLNGLDFTIEFWVYFNSVSAGQPLVSKYGNSAETAGGQGYLIDWVQSTSNLRLVLGSSAGVTDNIYTWSWSPSINTWYHVAVTRSGTSGKAFINGSQIGTTSTLVTNDIVSPNGLQIGKTHSVAVYLNGYVDDFRITKGYARYTTNFTAPISLFLTQ